MAEGSTSGGDTVRAPTSPAESLRLIEEALASTSSEEKPGKPVDTQQFLSALTALRQLRSCLSSWEPELITAARAHGTSWAELAPALGVASRQAAERRYLRLLPSSTGEVTGEQRVQAERDKRAGERAVATWARQNSATLRQLAGQVSAIDGFDGSGRKHADRLQEALGDDDPATLLSPLAEACGHLTEEHAALAEKLNVVTRHTDQVRQAAITDRHRQR